MNAVEVSFVEYLGVDSGESAEFWSVASWTEEKSWDVEGGSATRVLPPQSMRGDA